MNAGFYRSPGIAGGVNTVQMSHTLAQLRANGATITDEDLARVLALGLCACDSQLHEFCAPEKGSPHEDLRVPLTGDPTARNGGGPPLARLR